MKIEVVTLFPEFVADAVKVGVLGRALERGLASVQASSPREFAHDVHKTVDDRPYGGGPGMVLKVEPTRTALRAAAARLPAGSRRVYLGADGVPLTQRKAAELAKLPGLLLLAGRYEGVDERLLQTETDESLSIGDYVLSGGELPALVVIDAVIRLLPGVLGDEESAQQDSFSNGLLDWPHYTRPERIGLESIGAECAGPDNQGGGLGQSVGQAEVGLPHIGGSGAESRFDLSSVPAVLLGGNHAAIARWRMKQALGRTWLRRPDLLANVQLNDEQRGLLEEFKRESRAS